MNISSEGIEVRYNGNLDLITIKETCQNWGLSCRVVPNSKCVYFIPTDPEKTIEEALVVVREMVRQLDGLEWDK